METLDPVIHDVRALTFIALFAAQTVIAQTSVFAHQGILEFDGFPANGNFDFQFKLFDAASVGAQQGATLEQFNVTVANGAYSVNLDFGAAVFTGANRFLEASYRPAGGATYTTLTPRQLVTSSPYGIRSLVATSADGLSATCTNCVTSGQIQSVQGSQVTGSISGSQISGPIPVASVPAGSVNYIQNTTALQPGSRFNISGNGTVGGTLSANVVSATTQYNIGGNRVLSDTGNSTYAGIGAGSFSSGGDNAFFGRNAGRSTTGGQNAFLGSTAGFSNTAGQYNTFVGYAAGSANTTAHANTLVGGLAGQANSTGTNNSFFGFSAGNLNTTGSFNSFFGESAGRANTTSHSNSFFGAAAGYSNTTGNLNSFFGTEAGHGNTTGTFNSFFGTRAAYTNSTGFSNSFFGAFAGEATTTGFHNTFVGVGAGGSNTSGFLNTFLGSGAGANSTTNSGNVFVGYFADFATANPTGGNNTLVGFNTKVNSGVVNATAIGAAAQALTSNTIVLGTAAELVIVPGKLKVDNLSTSGSQPLCLNRNYLISTCGSSLRYKTDLHPFTDGMSIISRLQPISYTWKDGGQRDVGFGAEDVHKVEPLLVTYNESGLIEGVQYDRITVALVNALKEQNEKLKAIQSENVDLKMQLADVLARLEQIEKTKDGRK